MILEHSRVEGFHKIKQVERYGQKVEVSSDGKPVVPDESNISPETHKLFAAVGSPTTGEVAVEVNNDTRLGYFWDRRNRFGWTKFELFFVPNEDCSKCKEGSTIPWRG